MLHRIRGGHVLASLSALLSLSVVVAGCGGEEKPSPPTAPAAESSSAAPSSAPVSGIADPSQPAPPPAPAPGTPPSEGATVYNRLCAGCHGSGGQGVAGAGVSIVDEADEEEAELRATIQNGKGKMPAFKDALSPADLGALVSYLRSFREAAPGKPGEAMTPRERAENEAHERREKDGH